MTRTSNREQGKDVSAHFRKYRVPEFMDGKTFQDFRAVFSRVTQLIGVSARPSYETHKNALAECGYTLEHHKHYGQMSGMDVEFEADDVLKVMKPLKTYFVKALRQEELLAQKAINAAQEFSGKVTPENFEAYRDADREKQRAVDSYDEQKDFCLRLVGVLLKAQSVATPRMESIHR